MKGLIFNVGRYSVHDGPGIRVTFYMKGCPLNCRWCHNPEGISPLPDKVIQINRLGKREFSEETNVGREYTVEEILEILDKEKVFFNQSGGGVTFSGGEPMLQPEFITDALRKCKENGYHTAIDTSGYSSPENFRHVIPLTELFLFDIKHLDEAKHIEATGVSNSLILRNYKLLLESGKDLMIRIPVIPGFNDDDGYLEKLRKFLVETKTDSVKSINLLPYHRIGSSKYRRFKIPYRMEDIEAPSGERMNQIKEFFQGTGIRVKTGG